MAGRLCLDGYEEASLSDEPFMAPMSILREPYCVLEIPAIPSPEEDFDQVLRDFESMVEIYFERNRSSREYIETGLETSVTYQAGMNPHEWIWAEHCSSHRSQASNKLKEIDSSKQGESRYYYMESNKQCMAEAPALNKPPVLGSAYLGRHARRRLIPIPGECLIGILLLLMVHFGYSFHQGVPRSRTLVSCTVAIALLCTLLNLFKAIGIPPKAKAAGDSRHSESASMRNYRDADPENTSSGSDSMVAKKKGNAVAETAATWLVGSAEGHNMTGNRALLSDFKTVDDDFSIQMGDGRCMQVSGSGAVITDTMVLPGVWLVPGLQDNIVSVSQLIELNCHIVFNRDACYIRSADGNIIGKAPVAENGIFKLEFLTVPLVN